MPDLTQLSFWPFVLILGYPVLAIALLEFARHLAGRAPFAAKRCGPKFGCVGANVIPLGPCLYENVGAGCWGATEQKIGLSAAEIQKSGQKRGPFRARTQNTLVLFILP